jgi:Protein of unknown function (DUF3433)
MAFQTKIGIKAGRTEKRTEKRWTPASPSTPSLAVAFALFLSLLIGLLLLRYIVNHGSGLFLLSRNPYTWVYGPTALLVIVTSFWRQVDYHCKALRPWSELQEGPADADRTLLLDLVSPFQLVSLFNAATKRHYSVTLTITGFLILKVVTIASTGLLDLATVAVGPIDVRLQYTNQTNNATIYGGIRRSDYPFTSVAVPYTAYTIIDKGLPFSDGTTNDLAYEIFQLLDENEFANISYSADVQAFVPKVSCDPVEVDVSFNWTQWIELARIQAYSPYKFRNESRWTCSEYALGETYVHANNPAIRYCSPRQLLPAHNSVNCWPTGDIWKRGPSELNVYIVAIADLRYHQTWKQSLANLTFGDLVAPASWDFEVATINAFLCQIDYTIQTRHVTYDISMTMPRVSDHLQDLTETRTLGDFTDSNLTSELSQGFHSRHGGGDIFGDPLTATYQYVEQPPDSLFRMMSSYVSGDYATLLNNAESMRIAAQDVMVQMAVQIAKQGLFENSTSTLTEGLAYTTERLQLQSTSVYTLAVGFLIMAVATLIIWRIRPALNITKDPETIASQAKILGQSQLLSASLFQLTLLREKKAQQYIRQDRYLI